MTISDTTPEPQEVWLRMQSSLTGEHRLTMALEMSLLLKDMMKAGIRRDRPDWNEEQVGRELLRLAFLQIRCPLDSDEYLRSNSN